MEQQRVSNMPTGPCERIFQALNITPAFRSMRRLSYRPQPSMPERAPARTPPAADPAAPKVHPKTKPIALQPPNSVVPIIFESTVHPTPNEKEKLVVNVTAKPKGEMAEQEKKVAGQAVKATQNSEVTPSQEKPKPGAEMPTPSKVIAAQSNSQGAKATPKVETKGPHISNQVKPVPKVETVSRAKPLLEQGQQKVVTRDNSMEQGNKTVPNSGDRFAEFIKNTKIKMRATSDVGKNSSGPDSAKIKIKTSSNVGGGKSFSFKK